MRYRARGCAAGDGPSGPRIGLGRAQEEAVPDVPAGLFRVVQEPREHAGRLQVGQLSQGAGQLRRRVWTRPASAQARNQDLGRCDAVCGRARAWRIRRAYQ